MANGQWREHAFSPHLLQQPLEHIQNTCCILSSKTPDRPSESKGYKK